MIVRITGKLVQADSDTAVVDRDGICYELCVPAFVNAELQMQIGREVTFHTIQYYEGSAVGSNIYPRLVGFLDAIDRRFFMEFTKVKGLGMRKALKAMARPPAWIAEAIERGDVKIIATLPEIGKRSAEQLVASLRGRMDRFVAVGAAAATAVPVADLGQAEREAVEILLSLGERRIDAVELVRKAVDNQPLDDPARIVEAVYKLKSGRKE
ncbi:MAG: Holliday junction DNA helicase RuvA [Phycisphaerae bacterium]|nr:Holliday junction DNA helicase RuvA [Phycisphaerae bacterium]